MVEFGVIGFLVLVLIFFVMRSQNAQRELKLVQSAHKSLQSQNKYSLGIVMAMATQLQNTFQAKLAAQNSSGLINHKDYEVASFVLENFQFVVVQCCQHNETVEVAVRKALKGQSITIEEISHFVSRQPAEIKVPWCKNTIEGFVVACRNLVADRGTHSSVSESPESDS